MPRTSINVAPLNTRAGIVIGATSGGEVNGDPANNHFIAGNDGKIILHARNTAGTTVVTIRPVTGPGGFTFPNETVSVGASADKLIGPFPVSMFGDTVNIDVDTANVRLRAYQISGPAPSRSPVPPTPVAAGSRVQLPLWTVSRAGLDITAGTNEVTGDAANDHYCANDGNVIVLARATSVDVAYNPVAAFAMDGQAVADYVAICNIAAPVELAGPYPWPWYTQPDGNVYLNVASNTIRLRALWVPFAE